MKTEKLPVTLNRLNSFTGSKVQRKIVRVVKSRRMRWALHVARMGEDRAVHMVLVGKPE